MSLLRKVELEKDNVLITVEMTKQEYESISPNIKELVILPANEMERILITGKLGNGNRIMVPGKFLKSHNIEFLKKNVRSTIVDTGEKKFLVIELEHKKTGIPVFEEDQHEDKERV